MIREMGRIGVFSLLLATASIAAQGTFVVNMSGPQEVPGPGDVDGTASGTITLNDVTGLVTWDFTYANIAAPTLMHIHTGAAGVGGGILINLGVVTVGGAGTLIGSTTHGNLAQVTSVLNNSGGFYVNIHNADFPSGAVRGQVTAQHTYAVDMTGAQEVPGPGDADGTASGTITLNNATGMVSWNFVYANIAAPTLMHIHTGAAGVSGGILINLGVATSGGAGTLISSTTHGNLQDVSNVLNNSLGFYVNIHNAEFGAGAVRGQIKCNDDSDCDADGIPCTGPFCNVSTGACEPGPLPLECPAVTSVGFAACAMLLTGMGAVMFRRRKA